MVKKVVCRVVGSVPLGKTADILHHHAGSDYQSHRMDDFPADDVQSRPADRFISYLNWPSITMASDDEGLAGSVLDCYV